MEVYEAVRTVLATRSYQPEPVQEDVVRKILEAGRLSASSMNIQPWHFIVVDNRDDLTALGRMAKTGPYIAEAGLVVAVVLEPNQYAESDAGRAIQSMILTAWDEGIASNWVGYYGLGEAAAYLDVPEELDLFAIIPFGYSASATSKGEKKRKLFSEVIHRGRFGKRFDD